MRLIAATSGGAASAPSGSGRKQLASLVLVLETMKTSLRDSLVTALASFLVGLHKSSGPEATPSVQDVQRPVLLMTAHLQERRPEEQFWAEFTHASPEERFKASVALQCWLPIEDCLCSMLPRAELRQGITFWLYIHPKDFLRSNNTGKLLRQVLGEQAAKLCIFGVQEHEEAMWAQLAAAGRKSVWCLYPFRGFQNLTSEALLQGHVSQHGLLQDVDKTQVPEYKLLAHFVLVDGTWNNSNAMMNRLQEQARQALGSELECLSVKPKAHSVMHNLRPQPTKEQLCTAASAVKLLEELDALPGFSSFGLGKSAKALDEALACLQDRLSARRERYGSPGIRLA
eukprot:SM000004S15129  [mRNA]  locus=s4:1294013:1296494:- [translate_table: standard]